MRILKILFPWAFKQEERLGLLPDYRVYDMRDRQVWGKATSWVHLGERVMIFGRTPRVGDVVVSRSESGRPLAFLITSVDTRWDPGDQHFCDVARLGYYNDLPEPVEREGGDWTDGLIR